LTGLEANTSYDFYVRQNCGDDVSPWTGPFNFTTACGVTTAGFLKALKMFLQEVLQTLLYLIVGV
jgi:hypothetical protein